MALQYGLDPQQQMIADSAQKLFADLFSTESRRAFLGDGEIRSGWRDALADSGLLGVCAPDDLGGAGLGGMDALAIAYEAGRTLAPWPVAESIVGAALLAQSHPALARELIGARALIAFAGGRPIDGEKCADGWQVSATFEAVPWAAAAGALIAELRLDGKCRLALIELDRPGVVGEGRRGIDPLCPTARVVMTGVKVDQADIVSGAKPAWRMLLTVFACAEMLGAAQRCLDLAVDYMKVRKQFGQEIGRFQALKHIAADDALHLENMRLAAEYAAWGLDAGTADAQMAVHTAKQYCSEHARTVAEDAIQCHGGVGFTWDHDLHLYLRRILRLGASLGSAGEHREAMAAALIEELSGS